MTRSLKRLRTVLIAVLAMTSLCAGVASGQSPPPPPSVPSVARTPAIAAGEIKFSQHRWGDTIHLMLPQWRGGNRQFRVAYYIGASYCNLQSYSTGQVWLDHALGRMNPPIQSALIIASSRDRCVPASSLNTTLITTSEWSRRAEILYYGADPRLRLYKISGVDAVPGAVLATRIAPMGDRRAVDNTISLLKTALARAPNQVNSCTGASPIRTQLVGRFLFVTRVGTAPFVLNAWGSALEKYLQSLENEFGVTLSNKVITIHLARCPEEAATIANDVHGINFTKEAIAGYSVQEDMSILAIWQGYLPEQPGHEDNQTMRTLRHELAHLMLREWYGDIPEWLDEGLAQYLGVTTQGPTLGGTTVLHSSWGTLPSLTEIITSKKFQNENSCVTVAKKMMEADVTRMFVAYVDREPGRLRGFLRKMRSYVPSDQPVRSDRQMVEEVLGLSLDALDRAYRNASTITINDTLFSSQTGEIC